MSLSQRVPARCLEGPEGGVSHRNPGPSTVEGGDPLRQVLRTRSPGSRVHVPWARATRLVLVSSLL